VAGKPFKIVRPSQRVGNERNVGLMRDDMLGVEIEEPRLESMLEASKEFTPPKTQLRICSVTRAALFRGF